MLHVEAGREAGLLRLLRHNGVYLIDAFVPPSPCPLLRVAPGEYGDSASVISHRVNTMAIVRKFPRRPRLARIKVRDRVCLDIEADVNAAEQVDCLLNVSVILGIDADKSQDVAPVNLVVAPELRNVQFIEARIRPARQFFVES